MKLQKAGSLLHRWWRPLLENRPLPGARGGPVIHLGYRQSAGWFGREKGSSSLRDGCEISKAFAGLSTNLDRLRITLRRRQIERLTNAARRFPARLLHRARCFVAGLRDDGVLNRLALLVFDCERLVRRGVHQFDFDLAEGTIMFVVGW